MIPDTSQIYFPAEDTHLLIRAALAEVKESDRVLEVGTGSGAVAKAVMTIAKKTAATEINPHAAAYAAAEGVAVVRGNLLDPIRGGETVRYVIEWFLPAAIAHLSLFGRILLLVSAETGVPELLSLCKQYRMIGIVAETEQMEDGERLYVLRISRDLCCIER